MTIALLSVGVAVGSGADFTSRTANPANTFSAGSLKMDNSKDAAAIFSPSNMKPGGAPQTGTVDIANSGSIAGVFSLSADSIVSKDGGEANPAEFATKVNLVVTDCGEYDGSTAPACDDADDAQVYSGTLKDVTGELPLGDFSAGEKHRYQFAAALDDSTTNEFQGDSASAVFVWDAAQK